MFKMFYYILYFLPILIKHHSCTTVNYILNYLLLDLENNNEDHLVHTVIPNNLQVYHELFVIHVIEQIIIKAVVKEEDYCIHHQNHHFTKVFFVKDNYN